MFDDIVQLQIHCCWILHGVLCLHGFMYKTIKIYNKMWLPKPWKVHQI